MRARDFRDRVQRDGVQPLLHAEQQRLDNGQRQGKLQTEGRALSGTAFDFYCALQSLPNTLHYIQSNAASGNFRDLVGSAESGTEDERINFRVAEPRRLLCCDQALLNGPGLYFFGIHAAPVIRGLNDNLIALVVRLQVNLSMRWFTRTHTIAGVLNSVAYGISHQMGQWLRDR